MVKNGMLTLLQEVAKGFPGFVVDGLAPLEDDLYLCKISTETLDLDPEHLDRFAEVFNVLLGWEPQSDTLSISFTLGTDIAFKMFHQVLAVVNEMQGERCFEYGAPHVYARPCEDGTESDIFIEFTWSVSDSGLNRGGVHLKALVRRAISRLCADSIAFVNELHETFEEFIVN